MSNVFFENKYGRMAVNSTVILNFGMLLLLPGRVHAEFFKYRDSSGVMVITNKLEDVPARYRKRVKVVWDEDLDARDPLARRRAAAEATRSKNQQAEQKAAETRSKSRNSEKRLVVTFDEETGEIRKTFE